MKSCSLLLWRVLLITQYSKSTQQQDIRYQYYCLQFKGEAIFELTAFRVITHCKEIANIFSFTTTPTKDGIYWHRSELAYRMGQNFQPTIHVAFGTTAQHEGMFLQGNLQFFLIDGTYLCITNLISVTSGGMSVAALRGNNSAALIFIYSTNLLRLWE